MIDAIPGRDNHTWFEAPAGDYAARCSDLCGIQHARMTAQVKVVPRAQYEQFIAQRAAAPAGVALGKEEYQHACAVCHRLATAFVGPSLGANPLLTDAVGPYQRRITLPAGPAFISVTAAGDWSMKLG